MKVLKNTRSKRNSIILRIAVLAFSGYMLVVLAQLRMEIGERQKQLDELQDSIQYQQQQNEDMQSKSDNYKSDLEQRAYDRGMAVSGEIVFKEAQGAK